MKRAYIVVAVIALGIGFSAGLLMHRYDVAMSANVVAEIDHLTGEVCQVGTGRCAQFGARFPSQ